MESTSTAASSSSGPEMYNRREGAADIHGPMYEVKMAALLFLWAKNQGVSFKLFSNVANAGKFDDIVFKYKRSDGPWLTSFLQMKHKTSREKISRQTLNNFKGDFDLKGLYTSFCEIKRNINESDDGIFLGKIKHCLFVLFSNAQHELSESGIQNMSGGYYQRYLRYFDTFLKFDNKTVKIFGLKKGSFYLAERTRDEKERQRCTEFLNQFIICSGMPKEEELDDNIASEIIKAGHVIDFDEIEVKFVKSIIPWSLKKGTEGPFLSEKSDIFEKAVKEARVQDSLKRMCTELYLDVDFDESSLEDLKKSIQIMSRFFHILHSHTNPKIIFNKLLQVFKGDGRLYNFLSLSDPKRSERLSSWKATKNRVLVLVADGEQCGEGKCVDHTPFLDYIHIILKESSEKQVIFISHKQCGHFSVLEEIFGSCYKQFIDSFDRKDVKQKSLEDWLSIKINYQGSLQLRIKHFFDNYDNVKLELLNVILEKITYNIDKNTYELDDNICKIGKILMKPPFYYIDRTLERSNSTTLSHISPQTLLDIEDRIVVLAAEPGMGKTTILTYLASEAKQKSPEIWVVYIQLRDYYEHFGEETFNPKEFFYAMVRHDGHSCISSMEGILLQHTLNESGNICVAIDGYDEIPGNCLENVEELLKYLVENKVKKIWVSTRFSREADLLYIFKEFHPLIKSYTLTSFTEDDQVNFLTMYWENKIEVAKIKDIIRKINSSLNKWEVEFTGIPLQCLMIGEIFKDVDIQDIKAISEKLDIATMYEQFVLKKFRITYEEKNGSSVGRNKRAFTKYCINATNEHTTAAMVLLLDDSDLESLSCKNIKEVIEEFVESVKDGQENNGIVDRIINKEPNFVHRTYAEYFFGKWLAQNFQYRPNRTFIKKNLYKPDFNVVKSFFNRSLCQGYDLHTAVLNCNHEQVVNVLQEDGDVNRVDSGGRTALHLVSAAPTQSEENVKIVNALLDRGARVHLQDKVLQWRPLRYADHVEALDVVETLLVREGNTEDDLIKTKNIISTEDILRKVIQFGYVNIMRFLLENGLDANYIFGDDWSRPRLVHVTAECGQLKIMELLMEKGGDMKALNAEQRTPLHKASIHGRVGIVNFLITNISNDKTEVAAYINQRDEEGYSAMHWGALPAGPDVLRCLVEAWDNITITAPENTTILMVAANWGRLDTIKFIINHLEEKGVPCVEFINMQDERGNSAVIKASGEGFPEVIEFLAQKGADLTLTNNRTYTALHVAVDPPTSPLRGNYRRRLTAARVLLSVWGSRGSLLEARDKEGRTALDIARGKNYIEFVKLLSDNANDVG